MSQYLKSTWVRVGLVLLVVGATPLLFIITAAALGLWPDPNPNPVGPGILFGLTFWPAIICIVVGVIRARARDRKSTRLNSSHEWISYAVFCLKKKRNKQTICV